MATLPQQAPGPGPTAQALPSYLSYSPAATNTIAYTSTLTQVVYDPEGNFGPYQTVNVIQSATTSVAYSIVDVPLLYTGPFPAPDLGTLYTTAGQSLTQQGGGASATGEGSTPSSTIATDTPSTGPSTAAGVSTGSAATPTGSAASPVNTATLPTGQTSGAVETTQNGPLTTESAPTLTSSSAPASTASQETSPTTQPTSTSPTTTSNTSPGMNPTSTSGTNTESTNPSATATGSPNPHSFASNGLSGGQIAGIVLGAFFALLLLLMLLLCCLRRRRRRREGSEILAAATGGGSAASGGARGHYSALGAGAAATGQTSSFSSDDHLTSTAAGSRFFVVGGRRLDHDRRSSRSRNSPYTTANIPSSTSDRASGLSSLAAAGAGFFGAAFGRRTKHAGRVEIQEEEQNSDHDMGDRTAERQGLMSYASPPRGSEMREGQGRVFAPAAAVLAERPGQEDPRVGGSPQRSQLAGTGAMSRPTSSAYSGSGSGATSSSHTQRAGGGVSSSNSTGGFTTSGSGHSLPPPPRAPRSSPPVRGSTTTYGNAAPSQGSPLTSAASGMAAAQPQRLSAGTTNSAASANLGPALLGTGAALGGLGVLAAGHRESAGSSYSKRKAVRGSHASEWSAEELNQLRSTDPERYSRFISTGSTLLGPNYQSSPEEEQEGSVKDVATPAAVGASATQPIRLATIRSLEEPEEKGGSGPNSQLATGGNYGSLGASSGSRHLASPLPVYQQHDAARTGESLPNYTMHDQPGGGTSQLGGAEDFRTPMSDLQRFITPPDSPNRSNLSLGARDAEDDQGVELAETSAASAGVLGGVAAGWRRLTMGQFAWVPAASSGDQGSYRDSSGDFEEGRTSYDHNQQPSEDSSRLMHRREGSRLGANDSDVAPGTRRERARDHDLLAGPVATASHGSKDASGGSSEPARAGAPAQRSYPSLSSQHSSARSRAGYAGSLSTSSVSGRGTTSDSTGIDSLSTMANPSSRSAGSVSSRSGYSGRGGRSGGVSEMSFASTGAASYSPSGQLSRNDTVSTRANETDATGIATYAPSRRSGEAVSLMTDGATSGSDFASSRATGGSSSYERKRPRSSGGEGLRLDSLREGQEYPPSEREAMSELPNDSEPLHDGAPDGPLPPPSTSWRPSPRVTSASHHATEALLRPQQQPQGPRPSGPAPPRSQPTAQRSASYNSVDSSQPDQEADLEADGETPREESDEEDRWNRSFDWPKFLKF